MKPTCVECVTNPYEIKIGTMHTAGGDNCRLVSMEEAINRITKECPILTDITSNGKYIYIRLGKNLFKDGVYFYILPSSIVEKLKK